MAITITLYSKFTKSVNSTLQPYPSSARKDFTVTLKEDTSRYYPTFDIHTEVDISQYNYAHWDGRYYYVQDIIYYRHNSYYVKCEIDVMASWRANILSTYAFCERTINKGNVWLMDGLIPSESKFYFEYGTNVQLPDAVSSPSNALYIAQMAGLSSSGISIGAATQIFACSASDIAAWNKSLMNAGDTVKEELLTIFGGNLTNAFVDIKMIPVSSNRASSLGTLTNYQLGKETYGAAYLMSTTGERTNVTISFETRYNDFRAISCCRYLIQLPNIGLVELPQTVIANNKSVKVWIDIDYLGGTITYRITPSSATDAMQNVFFEQTANYSCSIATSTYNSNKVQTLWNAGMNIAGKASTLLGNALFGEDNYTMVSDALSIPQNFGASGVTNGGFLLLIDNRIVAITEYTNTSVIPQSVANVLGRPTYAPYLLSEINGYVKTIGASVSADAPKEFIEYMNATLDGGCFIE